MEADKIIMGAISIIIGLVLLPVTAYFAQLAKENNSTIEVSGVTSIIDLVLYGFTFGLVGVGIGMIYIGFKKGA